MITPTTQNPDSTPTNRPDGERWKIAREAIREYLCAGGMFNPEHMEHDKVRALLIDIADLIDGKDLSRTADKEGGGTT